MIVVCERCETRFQLDAARIPATGARVRCSRCKHAFRVAAPDLSSEETVHALAADAAVRGAATPPDVTADLDLPAQATAPGRPARGPDETADASASGRTLLAPAHPVASPAGAPDEEPWEFADQEPPARVRSARSEAQDPWKHILEEDKPPEALELDALGSPESWRFVSEEAPRAEPVRSPAAAARPARRVVAERTTEVAPEPAPPPAPRALERAGAGIAALLLVAIVAGVPWRRPEPPVTAGLPAPEGLVVEALALTRVDHVAAGPLLVVEGRIVNASADEPWTADRLRLRLVSSGTDGGSVRLATLRAPRSDVARREAPPESAQPLSGMTLRRGAALPFEAVFVAPPSGEARLELVPDEGVYGTEGAGPTTSSSPPSPPPSSG